jgi:polyhydroxyalkanoate synthesis regulator phasin
MNVKLAAGLAAAAVFAAGGGTAAWAATGSGAAAVPGSATVAASTGAASTGAASTGAASTGQAGCASAALAPLVSKGTITQAQATAIQNAMWAAMRGRLGDMRDRMASGTARWSGAPLAAVLGEMVRKGAITSAQAAAITQRMLADRAPVSGTPAGMMSGGHMGW